MNAVENITIRSVKENEVGFLKEIGETTFKGTFGVDNKPSDMEKYLAENFNIDKITSEFNNPESQFYFAEQDSTIIGYLKINLGKAQTETALHNALEIERIYVFPAYFGKNVGRMLIDKALAVAREKQCERVWLGVWEENPRAIRFYEKQGFVPYDKHNFMLGDDEQTDIMMKIELNQ